MQHSPGPAPLGAVLLRQPLARTTELQPRAVHQQVHRRFPRLWARHLQRRGPAAQSAVIRHREIEVEQLQDTLLHGSPGGMASGRLVWGRALDRRGAPAMPFKANRDRWHHIPKQRHQVTNWATYDASLRARGSLTVWFTAEAMEAWKAEPRTGRGGQPRYSDLAIATALTRRAVFRLALRQTEGLIWR